MKPLTQKFHGIPAAGITGATGETGDKGQSIYMGFVNDFFDCDEYEVAPEVKYTKRIVDKLRNSHTWQNYKNMYSMANIEQMYYTGEMVDVPNGFIVDGQPGTRQMDLVSYNDLLPGESLTRTYGIGDSQPVESYQAVSIKDVSYGLPTGEFYEYTDIYDFEDTTEEDKIFGYSASPAYTVRFDINHITYDYSDLRRLAEFKLLKGEPIKYSDFYTTFNDDGTQVENPTEEQYNSWLLDPQMFPLYVRDHLGGEYAQYREGVTEYYGIEYDYYDQYNNMYTAYMAWPLDNTKDGKHYMVMPDLADGLTAYDDMTYAFMYFKQPIITYPSYTNPETVNESEHMVDSDGIVYIGISDTVMYQITPDGRVTFQDTNDILMNLRADIDKPLNEQGDELVVFDHMVYINAIKDYTVTLQRSVPKDLMPTDDRVVWHPNGAKVVKIPRTLSKDIHVGDVIYFYTDETEFNTADADTNGKIKYMAVVTEEMVGCDMMTLLDKKQLVDPFTYKVIDTHEYDDRAEIKQSTVLTATTMSRVTAIDTAGDDDVEALHNFNLKSLENIVTEESNAGLTIVSANTLDIGGAIKTHFMNMLVRDVNQFDSSQKKFARFTVTGSSPDTSTAGTANFKVGQAGFQFDNLGIPIDNIKNNYELTDIIYDPNIKFSDSGHFICDFMNAGNLESTRLAVDSPDGNEYIVSFRFNKSDILKSVENLRHCYTADDYVIGYVISKPPYTSKDGVRCPDYIIDDVETDSDECLMTLLPFKHYGTMFKIVNNAMRYEPGAPQLKLFNIVNDKLEEYTLINYKVNSPVTKIPVVTEAPFEIKFTVRRKDSGIRYYSNTSLLSLWIMNSKSPDGSENHDVVQYTVTTMYPGLESSEAPTGSSDAFVFEMDAITCEDYTGAIHEPVELKISRSETDESNIQIKKILANGIDIYNLKKPLTNSWCTMTRTDDGSEANARTYSLSISDNIPDIASTLDSGTLTRTRSIEEFMTSLSGIEDGMDSPLFTQLASNKRHMSTVARYINITVCYTVTDEEGNETEYQTPYKITQPGFTDPRAIPTFGLNLSTTYEKLNEINTLDNGVMCNQFRTYLDIEIGNFDEMTWGAAGLDEVTMDFTVNSVPYDYTHIRQNPQSTDMTRPFIKPVTNTLAQTAYIKYKDQINAAPDIFRSSNIVPRIYTDEYNKVVNMFVSKEPLRAADVSNGRVEVYTDPSTGRTVKYIKTDNNRPQVNLDSSCLINTSLTPIPGVTGTIKTDAIKLSYNDCILTAGPQVGTQNYYAITCESIDCPVEPVISSMIYNNMTNQKIDNGIIKLDKEYVILNTNVNNMYPGPSYNKLTPGIRHDIEIKFSNIALYDVIANSHIRLAIDLEFGNPVIAQLFYQFAVTEVTVHYKGHDFCLKTSPVNKTYLSTPNTANRYVSYTFCTPPLKAYINPISMIAGSVEHERFIKSMNNVAGTVKKTGSSENISLVTELFNPRMYAELMKQSETVWGGVMPLSTAFNDDIQNLEIKTLLPSDVIKKVKLPDFYTEKTDSLSPVINTAILSYKPVLEDLSDNKYFTIFYNSAIMHPRFRNGVETFYYNNTEYEADKYTQYDNNNGDITLSPIYVKCEPQIQLRTDDEMTAIDTWNFEYQVYRESAKNVRHKTIAGKNSLYGNGWLFLDEKTDDHQYDSDNIMSLSELKERLSERIVFNNSDYITSVNLSNVSKYPDSDGLFRALVYDMKWEFPYETFVPGASGGMESYIGHSMLVSPYDILLAYCWRTPENKELYNNQLGQNSEYASHYNALIKRTGNDMIPYNLCYDITPRIAYNAETDTINVMMLRRPTIGYDADTFVQTETYYPDRSYLSLSNKIPEDATVDLYSAADLK